MYHLIRGWASISYGEEEIIVKEYFIFRYVHTYVPLIKKDLLTVWVLFFGECVHDLWIKNGYYLVTRTNFQYSFWILYLFHVKIDSLFVHWLFWQVWLAMSLFMSWVRTNYYNVPRLRISRHFLQILWTKAFIFIFLIPYLTSESISWRKISLLKFFIQIVFPQKKWWSWKPNLSNLCCGDDNMSFGWIIIENFAT